MKNTHGYPYKNTNRGAINHWWMAGVYLVVLLIFIAIGLNKKELEPFKTQMAARFIYADLLYKQKYRGGFAYIPLSQRVSSKNSDPDVVNFDTEGVKILASCPLKLYEGDLEYRAGFVVGVNRLSEVERFRKCVQNHFNTMPLEAENIQKIKQNAIFSQYRFLPQISVLMDAIKIDAKFTLSEYLMLKKELMQLSEVDYQKDKVDLIQEI